MLWFIFKQTLERINHETLRSSKHIVRYFYDSDNRRPMAYMVVR